MGWVAAKSLRLYSLKKIKIITTSIGFCHGISLSIYVCAIYSVAEKKHKIDVKKSIPFPY